MTKVRETCVCGAVFDYDDGQPLAMSARWAVAEFRDSHAVCRQRLTDRSVKARTLGPTQPEVGERKQT